MIAPHVVLDVTTVCLCKGDCPAEAQAAKAPIAFADLWAGKTLHGLAWNTIPCMVFTQLDGRHCNVTFCTGSSQGVSHCLWCFTWDEMAVLYRLAGAG